MAKNSNPNVLMEHLEKIVLAAAALLLAIFLAVCLPGSGTAVELQGTQQAPAESGKALLDGALRAEKKRKDQSLSPIDKYEEKLQYSQSPSFPGLRDPDGILPPPAPTLKGITDVKLPKPLELAEIQAAIPAPGKPFVKVTQAYCNTYPDVSDRTVRTLHYVYPYGKLLDNWGTVMEKANLTPTVLFVRTEIQVQEYSLDGKPLGEPRLVKLSRRPIMDSSGKKPLRPLPIPNYTGKNSRDIETALQDFAQGVNGGWEKVVLEPDYYEVLNSLRQWSDYNILLGANPVTDAFLKEDPNVAGSIRNDRPTYTPRPTPMPRGPMPRGPVGGWGDMDMPMARPMPAGPTWQPNADPNAAKGVYVPPMAWQKDRGQLLCWAFDDGNADTAKLYRYRVRLALLSPLLGRAKDVKDPNDAKPALVYTPWSAPTEEVSIPRETEIFLTGTSGDQSVSVTVYARYSGQRVKFPFAPLREGMTIGAKKKVEVPDLKDPNKILNPTVDFGTGATILSITPDVEVNARTTEPRKAKTVRIIYIDQQGRLHARYKLLDDASQRRKELESECLGKTMLERPKFDPSNPYMSDLNSKRKAPKVPRPPRTGGGMGPIPMPPM